MNISPKEYAAMKASASPHVLLDVRTAEELALARIDPCIHIPVQEISRRLSELEEHRNSVIVCLCHHGMRSAHAATILRNAGFSNVLNLSGGIDAYARDVEPEIGLYG